MGEIKNIVERHTNEGKFNLAVALCELEAKYNTTLKRLEDLEGSMGYCGQVVQQLEEKYLNNVIAIEKPSIQIIAR